MSLSRRHPLRLAPPVRRVVAAVVALSLASAPFAQTAVTAPPASAAPRTAPSAASATQVIPGAPSTTPALPSLWSSLPAERDVTLPQVSPSALQGTGASSRPLSPLPDLGDSSQVALSPAQERKVGETIMRQIRAQGGYLEDPEVNDYLNALGYRLQVAGDVKQDFEFFAVPDGAINAFALPGGYIGVNTGLILLAQNESELASVLAHEMSHVTQHHMARMIDNQKNSMLMTLAGLALAVLASRSAGANRGDTVNAAIASAQALSAQQQLNFTRDNEYEADRIGFQRLVAAGFDPGGAATFMERLQRSARFIDGNTPSYLRTHPITYERIAEAQARAQDLPYRQVPDSLEFHLVRALLKSYQGDAREQVTNFDAALRERKFNNEIAERYGLVAALLRAENFARAKTELARLEQIAPPNPMIDAMAGNVLMGAKDYDAAVKRFASALARYPNKMQLVYDYPEALLKAGKPAQASAFAEAQLLRFPGNGPLHRTAARAYAEQNMRLKEHQHQGEYYAWAGALTLAIGQMELAAKAGDGDFYQVSVVETRLRKLRAEQAELQKSAFGRTGLAERATAAASDR
ncbi:MAG: M48 family metallopeptidase [Burkholderiales bacterium]|nr:M48 family metallopeptidase [Burkholderiales bacterium]